MKHPLLLPLAALLLVFMFSGCASYNASMKPGSDLSKYQRVWVKSNMNDNRGIGQFICNALRARGLESDLGPLTMMPRNTQAIISFTDSWTWDFKDHMIRLELSLKDAKIDFPIATASYTDPFSLREAPDEVAAKLVNKLFNAQPAKQN